MVAEVTAKCGDCAFWTAPMFRVLLPASIRGFPKTSVAMHEPSTGLSRWFASALRVGHGVQQDPG